MPLYRPSVDMRSCLVFVFCFSYDDQCLLGISLIDCMSVRSIKPFVEELRSKGVTVECQPYELDGRMIYL